jgi:hypothetical protein
VIPTSAVRRVRATALAASVVAVLGLGVCVAAPAAAGQRAGGRIGAATGGATPAELQRMFDAYALIQAQQQLGIDDEHYPQFLARFKTLQDVRQQALIERTRRLAELRRLTNAEPVDEGQIKERLHELDALQSRTDAAVRDALAKIDDVLSVRQQALFRVFEEQMERQKVDLLLRARQAGRRQQAAPQ